MDTTIARRPAHVPAHVKTMKAAVYGGPGNLTLKDVPLPAIEEPHDCIVRMVTTTICGTDLHILKGDVPEVLPGRILGHEGVGIVQDVGAGVRLVKRGDRVLISCISSCAMCSACRKGMYSHCERGGGWVLGHLIDGTQAEYVRVPFADTSVYRIDDNADAVAYAMLSDILPTAYECGVLNGKIKPFDTVAIVGSGPIGLAAVITAQFYTPEQIIVIDSDDNRLETARKLGATLTINTANDPVTRIKELTSGRGVDVAIEAVGVPESFVTCENIVAAGGTIANIGVHGKSVELHLERLWSANIGITTRLVDTVTLPILLRAVQSGKVDPSQLVTHRFTIDQLPAAYAAFGHAAQNKALKVAITC